MDDLDKFLIAPDATLKDAIAALDATGQHICLVVDHRCRLLGTVSDGDIRRAILADRRKIGPLPTRHRRPVG